MPAPPQPLAPPLRGLLLARLYCVVHAKPYLKPLMTEACIQAENRFGQILESDSESHVRLDVVKIPLLPAVEHLSSVRECDELKNRRSLPAVLGADHCRVVAIKPVEAVSPQRIGAAQRRLKIERHSLVAACRGQ